MLKHIFITSIIILTFFGCELADITIPFNFEKDAPAWLKAKIENMQANHDYYGMQVIRYEWRNNFIYYFINPVSSCAYCSCDLFNQNGNAIKFSDDQILQDFLNNKINETLIWEWKP